MYEQIVAIIIAEAEIINQQLSKPMPLGQGAKTALFGDTGVLDSMGLVSLVVAVEQAIEDEFDQVITLADEKAMSQRNSPFRTVATLAKYIDRLLQTSTVG